MEFKIKHRKVNDSGFIPDLKVGVFKNTGEKTYFKKTNQIMGIRNGIGISESILNSHTKYPKVVIIVQSNKEHELSKYNGFYIAQMDDFRNSNKEFDNTPEDKQKFLSFEEMIKFG